MSRKKNPARWRQTRQKNVRKWGRQWNAYLRRIRTVACDRCRKYPAALNDHGYRICNRCSGCWWKAFAKLEEAERAAN